MDLPVLANTEKFVLSLNFPLYYYAPNQYVNLYSPLALGEGCIRTHLYSEYWLALIFWERDCEPGLAGRPETLSVLFLSCLFVMYTPLTAQLAFLFKKEPGMSGRFFVGFFPCPQHLPLS